MTKGQNKTNPADKVEQWPIEKLVPYAKNSRTHSDAQVAQIAASIKEWGFTTAVLVDESGSIIAGHGRVMAARKLGMTSLPVMVATGWTDAQKRAYVIADNKLALNAGWDNELLSLELGELGDLGFDLELTGFTDEEIKALMPVEVTEGLTDEDEVPEVPVQPVTVTGDVWLLGKHRLVCGDATSPDDWDKLQIKSPSMVFSSPPYGVGENAKLRDKYVKGAEQRQSLYATHDDNPDQWPDLMRGWTNLALTHTQCVVCNVQTLANNKRNLARWQAEYADHLIDVAIWDKGHGAPQMQRNVLTNVFEWIFILSPEENASRALPLADFHGSESNMVRIGKGQREFSDIHRATMPVELAEWSIKSIGPKSACVVDPFGGTGTTMIAAEKHGKSARLIELDPKYCDVIVKRWQDFTGKQAIHAETGKPFAEVKDGNEETAN
jgi:DNA modification methylase